MNKKIGMLGIIGGAVVAMALISACGSTPSSGTPAVAAAAQVSTEAKPIATVCADVIKTGEANHAAYAASRTASKNAETALDALLNSPWDAPDHDAIKAASDEASAQMSIATANVTTTSQAYQKAKDALTHINDCWAFIGLDMQFLNAHTALASATPATQAQAEKLLADAQAAWDAAKAGV